MDHKSMAGVSVEYLKRITFSLLPLSEKLEVVRKGRPTPNILTQSSRVSETKKYLKNFNHKWYEKIKWLCGCETTNALFCFPCLLFGGDTVWTQNGFTNFSKMKEKTGKHQNSRRHMANMISLTLLSQANVSEQLNENFKMLNNKKGDEYQQDLSKIIDCLKFIGKFELSLKCQHSEFFNKIGNFASNFDTTLRNHILFFGETSESVQNDLLQHMLEVCREEIISEIQEASYVSVICEDVTDISEFIQTIIIFRYEFHGVVHEHFWGFLSIESVHRNGLSNCLLKEINRVLINDWNKLIAHTFRGPVKVGEYDIQSVYHNAHFIHSFSSDFDLELKYMTNSVYSVRLFFANLESLDKFFRQSSIRSEVLCRCINENVSQINSLDVCTVYKIKNSLIKCFENLLSSKTTDKTFEASARFLNLLKNDNFLFWLEIFNKIILHFELFYQDIQSVNPDEIPQTVSKFCKLINKICFESGESFKILDCEEVSNCICDEIKERFAFFGHLTAARLFDRTNFERFHYDLPICDIKKTCQAYPDIIENKLIMELKVFYSQKKFQNLGILNILHSLNNEGLFSETIKLLKILITIPTVLPESDSVIKKVKSCIRDTVNEEKLSALCMMFVESEMVLQIKNFNEKVVEKYFSDRKLEFYLK